MVKILLSNAFRNPRYIRMILLLSIVSLVSCQRNNDRFFAADARLEWARDLSDDELPIWVDLDTQETEDVLLQLQIAQTGIPSGSPVHVAFRIDTLRSTAIPGEHVVFPAGMTTVIPANERYSDSIPIEILSEHVQGDKDLRLVLVISEDGEIPPAQRRTRRELTLYISKALDTIPVYTLSLQQPGNNSGMTMVDLDSLTRYTRNQANLNKALQRQIDFGFWNSSSKDYVFMVPTSYRLGAWGSGVTIRDEWVKANKNDGVFMKLPASPDNDILFTGSQTSDDLQDAFQAARQRVTRLETYDYGPHGHIHFLQTGDLVFFHSLSRNIRAIMRVEAATSGNSGTMELSVKRIIEYK